MVPAGPYSGQYMVQTMIGLKQYVELFPFPETIKNLRNVRKKDKIVFHESFFYDKKGFRVIQLHQLPSYS